MPAKRQHFNPVLHLRHFVGSDPRGQVWTFDKDTGEVRSARPENTAVQSHFYSAERDDGTMDTRIEDYLAEVESNAAPVYEALLRGDIPNTSQPRADFAQFLALTHVRTPAMRRIAGELAGRHMQIMNYAYARDPKAFDDRLRRLEKGWTYPHSRTERAASEGFIGPIWFHHSNFQRAHTPRARCR